MNEKTCPGSAVAGPPSENNCHTSLPSAQSSTVQYSTVQYNTVQYSSTHHLLNWLWLTETQHDQTAALTTHTPDWLELQR